MILKIQVPLESNIKDPPALVYDKNRSVRMHVPVTADLKMMMDGQPKIYVVAHIHKDTISIEGYAPDQDW